MRHREEMGEKEALGLVGRNREGNFGHIILAEVVPGSISLSGVVLVDALRPILPSGRGLKSLTNLLGVEGHVPFFIKALLLRFMERDIKQKTYINCMSRGDDKGKEFMYR